MSGSALLFTSQLVKLSHTLSVFWPAQLVSKPCLLSLNNVPAAWELPPTSDVEQRYRRKTRVVVSIKRSVKQHRLIAWRRLRPFAGIQRATLHDKTRSDMPNTQEKRGMDEEITRLRKALHPFLTATMNPHKFQQFVSKDSGPV